MRTEINLKADGVLVHCRMAARLSGIPEINT